MNFDILIAIATAVILFMYGIDSFSREVKNVAGDSLRRVLTRWTKRPLYGMTLGALVTAFIQSSTATSVLTVSLVNSSIINFRQSIGILLGTNIGTTITAFLVAFKLTNIGPWFIVLGFFLSVVRVKYSFLGKALFYFGLVFFALSQISLVTTPLKNDPGFASLLAQLNNPLYGILAGCGITMLIQSSSVTSGLVVILVQSGALALGDAIPVILGANIGTTFTGIIASLSMDQYARRAAAVNTLFNVGGVLLFLPFLTPFVSLINLLGGTPGELTAMAHFLFNTVSSTVFVFLIRPLEALATRIIKSDQNEIVFETPTIEFPLKDKYSQNLKDLEMALGHYFLIAKNMMAAVVSYIDLRTREGFDRIEKYHGYSQFIAHRCEKVLHQLIQSKEGKEQQEKLVLLFRLVDYIRQTTASQKQVGDIPELLRLPNVAELTDLKSEVFALGKNVSQIYDHLVQCFENREQNELTEVDKLMSKLGKTLNTKYEEFIFSGTDSPDKIHSFLLAFLTRTQSIRGKLFEIRRLSSDYFAGG